MKRPGTKSTAVAVLLIAITTACSGESSAPDETAPTTTTTTEAAPTDAVVAMSEWRFGPAAISLAAGTEVTLELRNDGALLHEWALLTTEIEDEAGFGDDLVIVRRAVNAGAVDTVTFTVPAAGTYQFVCPIPGHLAQGMEGTLTATG